MAVLQGPRMAGSFHDMVVFEWRGSRAAGRDLHDRGIADLFTVSGSGGPGAVATTGRAGGLAHYGLTEGTVAMTSDRGLTVAQAEGAFRELALVETEQGRQVIVGTGADGDLLGLRLSVAGELSAPRPIVTDLPSGSLESWTALVQTRSGALVASGEAGLHLLRPDGAGGFTRVGGLGDTGRSHLAGVTHLGTLEIGGDSLVLAASGEERGISCLRLGAGGLVLADSSGPEEGLGVMTPTDMVTVMLGGRGYVILASAPEAGASGALSVWEVSPEGELTPRDHLLDSLETRFGLVQCLSAVTIGDRVYLLAGGGDDGLTLFSLLPGGRLQPLGIMVDSLATGLDGVQALAAVAEGAGLRALVATQADAGPGELSVRLPEAGRQAEAAPEGGQLSGTSLSDILIGGPGEDRIFGGAGADILSDGAGRDRLSGGAGADLFVLTEDGTRDRIDGFDPASDRLDLSGWRLFHDPASLSVRIRDGMAEVGWRSESLVLTPAEGRRLTPETVRAAVLQGADRPYRPTPEELEAWGPGGPVDPEPEPEPTPAPRPGPAPGETEGAEPSSPAEEGPVPRPEEDRSPEPEGDGSPAAPSLRLQGGIQADSLKGQAGADSISGGGGADILLGGRGQDRLWGDEGDDRLFGGRDGDRLWGGTGRDTLVGNEGADVIYGGVGDDVVRPGEGRDSVYLGAGNDRLLYLSEGEGPEGGDRIWAGPGNDEIETSGGDDWIYGMEGADRISGGAGDDHLWGGPQGDVLSGGPGADVVTGGDGPDTAHLGEGNDIFLDNSQGGELGADTVFANQGDDTIQGGNGDDVFHGQIGRDVIHGRLGNDRIYGGPHADRLYAGAGDDLVAGGDGPDLVYLGPGDDLFLDTGQGRALGQDTVHGLEGNDRLQAGGGDDRLFGGVGEDLLVGRLGDDALAGGPGADRLYGGPGDDRLEGGPGPDLLFGGPGADTFVFRPGTGRDRIADFTAGEDRILLAEGARESLSLAEDPGGQLLTWEGGEVLLAGLEPGELPLWEIGG